MRYLLLTCILLTGCATTPALVCPRPNWPQQPRYPLSSLKANVDDATLIKAYVATVQGQQYFINNQVRPFFK